MDSTLQTSQSSLSEQKYINLRKRLDQLGYRQTLGIESLPLIEKLFNDLVHTTESLKKAKLDISRNVEHLNTSLKNTSLNASSSELIPSSIQAYKSDNAKLIKENNELHLQFIKVKDDYEGQLKELKFKLNKVEHENSDLRFLNTQYLHKLRAIEKESKDKSKKILELQEKNFQAVIQTPTGTKQTISFRRQRLDIDCMLPPSQPTSQQSTTSSSLNAHLDDPYLIDMIKLADERINQLQTDLDEAKQSKDILENKLSNYKSQIDNRDREIERLNRLLDGGRAYDVVSLEANIRNNEKLITHQNLQIDFLQEKNHQLERQVADLKGAKREVISEKYKNDDLVRDIREINKIAKKAEIEKKLVANAADRELDHAKFEIQKSREELNSLDSTVHQLEIEKRNLMNELNSLRSEISDRNNELNNLHTLVDKIQDDKNKLTKKISKLIDNEKELVQELDSSKNGRRNSNTSRTNNTNKSLTAKLDSHIKNIENERDFFKQEVDTLQKLLKSAQHECLTRSVSTSRPSLTHRHRSRKDSKGNNETAKSPISRQNSFKNTKSCSRSPSAKNKTSPVKCCICSGNKTQSSPSRHTLITSSTSPFRSNMNDDARQLRRERDELQILLDKFEHHMAEIQSNVKVLTNERDKYMQLYDEARNEIQHTRRDMLKSSKNQNNSLAAQSILKRAEMERDNALCDLRTLAGENDSLKERLKITTDTVIKDKSCLEQQIDDLQSVLRNMEQEKKDLCQQVDLLQRQLDEIESKFHEQNYHLAQTNQDLNDHKSTATQIRLLAEESERALDEQRRQLAIKNDELHTLEQANYRFEQKLIDSQEINRSLKEELNALRSTINALDNDKDKLLNDIDEKTIENVTFKQELASKHRRIDELNTQLSQLDTALDRANDDVKSKQKEITALRIQLDRTNEENCEYSRRLDGAIRENKRLQDDLITITRENQVIHCELDKSNGDKEHLKEQLQDYINEVSKFEEMLNQKERDRSNLLEQYRDLTNELNTMKLTLNAFENETNNLKIEIQMKHNDNKRLRERLDGIEREYQQQMSACQEYDVKLSGANRGLQRLEETFKKLQQENKEMAHDLLNSREINSRLEQNKEDLMRQLTSKELDFEQMHNELADRRAETDLLKSQVNSERSMVKNLEDLIASNREKDFQMQLSHQERDSEIKLLKDRIMLSEQKIQTQNKEISNLRSKLVEIENDSERLKRQLTNERFERERAAQELRKITDNGETRYISPSRSIQCHVTTPISSVSLPLPLSSSCSNSNAAAACAAACAAVAATNNAISCGYKSLSPVHSRSPSKESIYISTSGCSALRYSSERRISPTRGVN